MENSVLAHLWSKIIMIIHSEQWSLELQWIPITNEQIPHLYDFLFEKMFHTICSDLFKTTSCQRAPITLRQTAVSWSLMLSAWVSDGRFPGCGEDVGCIQMIYPSPCSVFDWGRGEECYHWSVSHPDPSLPLSHHFTCKCVYVSYVVLMSCTSCLCTHVMLLCAQWRMAWASQSTVCAYVWGW